MRLSSLGYTRLHEYTAGKREWAEAGLAFAGTTT